MKLDPVCTSAASNFCCVPDCPVHGRTRAQRRAETARMTKCGCGNVAQNGKTECSRCERDRGDREDFQRRFEKFYADQRRMRQLIETHVANPGAKEAILWLIDNAELKAPKQ